MLFTVSARQRCAARPDALVHAAPYSRIPAPALTGCLPGGLSSPFASVQHDDAITPTTYQVMQAILKGKQSRNGCPAVATMFTTFQDTGAWELPRALDPGCQPCRGGRPLAGGG